MIHGPLNRCLLHVLTVLTKYSYFVYCGNDLPGIQQAYPAGRLYDALSAYFIRSVVI